MWKNFNFLTLERNLMHKKAFFDHLAEIIDDKMFITDQIQEIQKEIDQNCWSFDLSANNAEEIEVNDLVIFLHQVKQNRIAQLIQSSIDVNLIYYLWHDEMAGHLRFNFINDKHKELPFGCKLRYVDTEEIIIADFLNSDYLNGIPFSELTELKEEDEIQENTAEQNFVLQVYVEQLRPLQL